MGLNQGGHSFALRALPSAFDSMPTHDYHPLCCTAQVHALTSSHAPGPFSMHPGIVGPHGGARPPLPWPAMTPDGLAGLAGHSELPPPPPGMTTHERLSQLLETEMQHGHLLQALPPLRPQHNVSALLGSSLSASPTTPTHQHTDTSTHRHTDTRHTDTPTHRLLPGGRRSPRAAPQAGLDAVCVMPISRPREVVP